MRHGVLLGVAWLGVVGAVAFAATIVTADARAQAASCQDERPLLSTWGSYDPGVDPPSLATDETNSIDVPFDNTSHDAADSVELEAGHWNKSLQRSYGLVLTFANGSLQAGKNRISSTDRDHLFGSVALVNPYVAVLCLHVKKGMAVHAGRYSGRLQVSAGDQVLASVPVELTHRDSWAWAVGAALLGVLLGITVKGLSEAAAGQRTHGVGPWQALKAYARQLVFPLSVIVGFVAGVFVFKQVYFDDPGWGGSSGIMTLFGLCFVGQLSSNEGINLVRRAVAA